MKNLPPCVIWLTGLSGSGKSTIARLLVEELGRLGLKAGSLDGDALRQARPGTGFSRAERSAHVRRAAREAARLEESGAFAVVSLISPYEEDREFARRLCRRFIEVHVSTPLPVCESRDPKGLYAKARRGEIRNFTGLDDPYEPPRSPELVIDASSLSPQEGLRRIMELLREGRLDNGKK